jgi:ribokinase
VEPDIVVIGSVNYDLTLMVSHHPAPGETVLTSAQYSGGGGKGANQAVGAARLGANVTMVGRVGGDEHGRTLLEAMAVEGIGLSAVGVDEEEPTGLAVITIDDRAENTIVVSPGANMRLLPIHLDDDLIANAPVVLAQLEVPIETVTAAARLATGTFILNPAPGRLLTDQLKERVDILVPNRSELGVITDRDEPRSNREVEEAARSVGMDAAVVVTLGPEGALVVGEGQAELVPAPAVTAVDPTGAGDAFCAALAHGLGSGMDLVGAVERAVVAGALATTRPGAQAAMPSKEEVESALGTMRRSPDPS